MGKTHEVKAMPEPRLIERVADSLDEAQGETSPTLLVSFKPTLKVSLYSLPFQIFFIILSV